MNAFGGVDAGCAVTRVSAHIFDWGRAFLQSSGSLLSSIVHPLRHSCQVTFNQQLSFSLFFQGAQRAFVVFSLAHAHQLAVPQNRIFGGERTEQSDYSSTAAEANEEVQRTLVGS